MNHVHGHHHGLSCIYPPMFPYLPLSRALLPLGSLPFPPLPFCALLVIAATEFRILVNVLHGQPRGALSRQRRRLTRWWWRRQHTGRCRDAHHVHEIARVLRRVQVLVNQRAQRRVGGVDELVRRQAALVAQARVGPGLEHHLDERGAKVTLRGGFGVEPADGGV